MKQYLVVLCSVGKADEAHAIARTLVDKRLAACVNVVSGVTSHYLWKGAIERDEEWLLVVKTRADRFETLREAITAAHSYEVPEVVALPIACGHAPYLAWIDDCLS